jgi:hypothetical protein
MPKSATLETNLEISKKITELILAYCRSMDPDAGNDSDVAKQFKADLTAFRQFLSEQAKKGILESSLVRDDIETAMFAMRVILEDFPETEGRVTRLNDIDRLLAFCRLGRGGTGALDFVRPYYDCAISALIKLEPKDTKQLIEVTREAMTGKPYFKTGGHAATLVFYCGPDCNYFFLDVPRGPSAVYPFQGGIDFDRIRALSRGESPSVDQLTLPAALRKELLAVNGDICLCWRDEVKQLGTSISHNTAKVVLADADGKPSTESVDLAQANKADDLPQRFPFTVPDSIRLVEEQPAPDAVAKRPALPLSSNQGQTAKNGSLPQ